MSDNDWNRRLETLIEEAQKKAHILGPEVANGAEMDRCKYVWENFYQKVYNDRLKGKLCENKNGCKMVFEINPVGHLEWVSGDVTFNFAKEKKRNKKYEEYKKIIESDKSLKQNDKRGMLDKLNNCLKMNYSYENFTLMVVTGNIQAVKGNLDRPDFFLYVLNTFVEKRNCMENPMEHPMFKRAQDNGIYLYNWLSKIDVYQYCQNFWLLRNVNHGFIDIIDRMNENGEKEIEKSNDVDAYMNLAIEFWEERQRIIKELLQE